MHSAVPEATTSTCASPPSPASLQTTLRVFPDCVTVHEPIGCGLPGIAAGTAIAAVAKAAEKNKSIRRIRKVLLVILIHPNWVVCLRALTRRAERASKLRRQAPPPLFDRLRRASGNARPVL